MVVFGFGTGRTLESVRRVARDDARISVVVLDPRGAISTLERHDRSAALSDPRVRLLCGDLQTVARSMPPGDETLTVVVDPQGVASTAPELRPLAAMALELEATQRSRRRQIVRVLDATPDGARIGARRVELAAWLARQQEVPARPLWSALPAFPPVSDRERDELGEALIEAVARARARSR